MSDDDLERRLADSFDRSARASVGDGATPPRPRYLEPLPPRRHRVARWAAPLAAAAAVVGVVIGIAVVQNPSTDGTVADRPGQLTSRPPSTSASSSASPATAVHVALLNPDHHVVGVGMPVVAYFSKPITDARALQRATALTVDGKPAEGAWYFERTQTRPGYPIEGHLRMPKYWPANAKIHLSLPIRDLPAGGNLAYGSSLTLDFATGPANIVTVDERSHKITVTSDGKVRNTFPTSLGASRTPTIRGTKVIMEKAPTVCMHDVNDTYYECGIKYDQRLTYSGEYLHAAPWNSTNITRGIDTSNGCTNLLPADAKRLYETLRVGDVVEYPNAAGPLMTMGDGYGDWNLSWSQWQTGGAVPTR